MYDFLVATLVFGFLGVSGVLFYISWKIREIWKREGLFGNKPGSAHCSPNDHSKIIQPTKITGKKLIRLACVCVALTLLISAAYLGSQKDSEEPLNLSGGEADSHFTDKSSGRWANDFTNVLHQATSDVQRDAVIDGVIDDQEYAYFRSQILQCLSGLGIEASFSADKSLRYANSNGVSQQKISHCMSTHGLIIVALRDAIDRNPNNLDESEIMVSCLMRSGVVDQEYTPEDFQAEKDFESVLANPAFEQCHNDPLNLLH